jgi:hypothetical protein
LLLLCYNITHSLYSITSVEGVLGDVPKDMNLVIFVAQPDDASGSLLQISRTDFADNIIRHW